MRDDLQQLPPMLITLLSGGKRDDPVPMRHITMPEEFVREKKAPQQQMSRPASGAGGRTHSNRVGPLGNEHMDQADSGLRQRLPTKDAQVNTEPRRRFVKNSAHEEADTDRPPQPPTQAIQEPILLKKKGFSQQEARQWLAQKNKQKEPKEEQQPQQQRDRAPQPPPYRPPVDPSTTNSRRDSNEQPGGPQGRFEPPDRRPSRTYSQSSLVEVVVSDRENLRVTEVRLPTPQKEDIV